MSSESTFVSHARNREDVVLWRALGGVPSGTYLEVDPRGQREDSPVRALRDHGWTGRTVDPEGLPAALDERGGARDVHLLVLAGGAADQQALAHLDLTVFRPWVLLVEEDADGPAPTNPWEPGPLDAGYVFCLFDGIWRFYVAREHVDDLQADLIYPACARDTYVEAAAEAVRAERDHLSDDVHRWRAEALFAWADATRANDEELIALRRELADLRGSLSWRVTGPLRSLHLRGGRR